ncbi:Spanin, inner membrane subunit [Comamonadaceae bacterium]
MNQLIISMAVAALGFAGGWVSNGWRLGGDVAKLQAQHSEETARQAKDFNDRRTALLQARDALSEQLGQLDKTHTEQLTKARNENKSLSARIAAGSIGLRIDATCPGTGAGQAQSAQGGSVDPGAGAELSAFAKQTYSALRDNITETEKRLSACQGALALLQ